jgi:hypothetical protein
MARPAAKDKDSRARLRRMGRGGLGYVWFSLFSSLAFLWVESERGGKRRCADLSSLDTDLCHPATP